jgi:hypothetical protein
MERVSRRRLLAAGSSAALASAVIGSGVAAAQGTRPPGQPLTDWIERYVLVTDLANSKSARPAPASGSPTGPAYFTGSLFKDSDVSGGAVGSSANSVGRFRLAGWVYGGGAAPQIVGVASFDLAGRGKITLTGASGPVGSLAVSGGTGDFAGVGGEARLANLAPGGGLTLIIEFNLLGGTPGR